MTFSIITISYNAECTIEKTLVSVASQSYKEIEHIIVDGAMFYAYQFRSDTQAAQISQAKFETGIKYMRSLYINHYDYVRSTVISHPRSSLRAL